MEQNILIYPDNGEELISMYLPGGESSPQIRELRTLEAYLQNKLDPRDPRRKELMRLPVTEVHQRVTNMRKIIFHLSMKAFATDVCNQQCEICEQNFYDAPNGEEAQWIAESRMPDIYEKGEYERLAAWWSGLPQEQQLEIVRENFEQCEDMEDEELLAEFYIDRFWQNIRVDLKEELYRQYA